MQKEDYFEPIITRSLSAATLLIGNDKIGLQLRDLKQGIDFPGKVSFFGGALEKGETPLDCLVREIEEELGYQPAAKDILKIGQYDHIDGFNQPSILHIYVLFNAPVLELQIREGNLCMMDINKELSEVDLIPSHVEPLRDCISAIKSRS